VMLLSVKDGTALGMPRVRLGEVCQNRCGLSIMSRMSGVRLMPLFGCFCH